MLSSSEPFASQSIPVRGGAKGGDPRNSPHERRVEIPEARRLHDALAEGTSLLRRGNAPPRIAKHPRQPRTKCGVRGGDKPNPSLSLRSHTILFDSGGVLEATCMSRLRRCPKCGILNRVDTVLNVKSKNKIRMNKLDHKVSQILEHPGLRLVIFS